MSNKAAVEQLKQKPFIIKEGTEYRYPRFSNKPNVQYESEIQNSGTLLPPLALTV